jgi:Xaa-Pro dipeptidase
VAGFHSQTWVSPTRQRDVLFPVEGEPIAVVPTSNVAGFRTTSGLEDVRGWPAPRPAADGVSLVVDALRSLVGHGKVAPEIGPEMRVARPSAWNRRAER